MLVPAWLPLLCLCASAAGEECDASEVSVLQLARSPRWPKDGQSVLALDRRSSPVGPSASDLEAMKSEYDQIMTDALKGLAPASQEVPTPPKPPGVLPAIHFGDQRKTKAAWQSLQKTYDNGLRSPALGWNSWNQFNLEISQSKVLAVAEAMKSSGLLASGFEYIILDDGWGLKDRDVEGRLQADPTKFPKGMRWLGDRLHSLGFKFGLYTSVGSLTCGGGQPGILGHHTLDAETFASWAVDYVKVDRCGWPGELFFAPGLDPRDLPELARIFAGTDYPVHGKYPKSFYDVSGRVEGYQNFSAALNATGRVMYYEICDWGEDDTMAFAPQIANSYRFLWDNFPQWHRLTELYEFFAQVKQIPASVAPGAYAFAMMEGGVDGHLYNRAFLPASSLTQREAATELAMWSMWSCPLVLGFDVANPEKSWESDLLKNPELLKINQDPLAIAGRLAARRREKGLHSLATDVWVKPLKGGSVAAALVNMGDSTTQDSPFYKTETITLTWEVLGLPPTASANVYSATLQRDLGTKTGSVAVDVAPHGATVLVLTPLT